MSAIDQCEELRSWMRAEIDAQAFGDEFRFTVTEQAGQGPQGPVDLWTFKILLRSPLLGQGPLMYLPPPLTEPQPTPETIRRLVTDGLKQLRDVSRQMLAGANGGKQ